MSNSNNNMSDSGVEVEHREVNLGILLWNIRGSFSNKIKRELVIEKMINTGAGVMMIQEPGDLTFEEVQEVRSLFQRIIGQVKIIYQRTNMRFGGTMIILVRTWVNRCHSIELDIRKLCRFNIVRLRGMEGKLVTLINLYRPHFQSTGINSVVEKTRRYLEEHEMDNTDPEELWDKDLRNIIAKEEIHGAVIIGGDFNHRLEDNIMTWKTFEQGQLYNVLLQKYDNNQIPPTRIPGETGAIDHIYTTRQMRIIEAEILEETDLSDHLPIKATFLGHGWFYHITPRNTYINRVMNSNNPQAIKKFRETLDRNLKKNNVPQRIKELQQVLERGIRDSGRIREFSDLVTEIDNLTIAAEETALGPNRTKRNLSKIERVIRYEIICWGKLVAWLRYSGENKWKKTKMRRIMKLVGRKECEVNTMTITEATTELKNAWNRWKEREEAKWRNVNDWRYYDEAIGRQELGDIREVETIIASLKHQAKMKQMHTRIKGARGKIMGEGLTILEVENNDGTKSQIHEKEQIERIAMEECYKKVHTADKTTLWKSDVDNLLRTSEGPDQWRNLYDTQDFRASIDNLPISNGAKLFIKEMGNDIDQDENIDFDNEQYWTSWKRQKEKTASDGRINFSHFMNVEKHSIANEVRTQIARIRLNMGITPEAYKRATDLLLLKQPNDFRPHRMRLITLQHAASNHDFKYIGKQINIIGERRGLFSECQYGSRNKKSAALQALNKSLLIDISRVKKRSIVIIANDAKSCYDRIILWVLYFTMRKFGMPHSVAKTSVETIQDMIHNVSTVHGISESFYGGSGTLPNGVLQGNGFAAQAWAAISSILFNLYENAGFGAKIESALEDRHIQLAGMAFVDDTDLMDMERDNETVQDLLRRTQAGLDLWNQLIEVTGGALEPRKTDWCIVRYEKEKGKWKAKSMDATLTLEDEDTKQRIDLKQLQPEEARRTLGIWQAGIGQQQTQTNIILDNIRCYGQQIKTSGLSRSEKELGLQSTITRTIAYGAPATSLNKAQAEEINKELRRAAIQGLGVPKTTPIALIHGPRSLNGLQIMDYFTFQMGEHLKILMDHLDTRTRTGDLIQILITEHTLELGIEESIWELRNEKYLTMISESWIKNTLQAMIEHKIRIKQYQPVKLKKWRMGDKLLMNMFLKIPGSKLSPEQWHNIQEVRRYLRINTLSDILVNGMIDEKVWNGESAKMSVSRYKYKWMNAVPPNPDEIKDWQYALQTIGIGGPNRMITNTLGSWFEDAITQEAWADKTLTFIYIKEKGKRRYYEKATAKINRNGENIYQLINYNIEMEYAYQVRIATMGDKIQMFDIIRDTTERNTESNEQYFNRVEVKAPKYSLDSFAMKLQEGRAILVTDASDDKEGNLVAAFGEQLPMLQELDIDSIVGWAQIPSTIEDADSFRAELGGILAAVRFTINVARNYNIQEGACEIKADNYSALQTAEKLLEEGYPHSGNPSFDILRILWKALAETDISFRFTWVRGHQDRTTPYIELTDDARANCKADQIAAEMITRVTPIEKPRHDMDEGPYLIMDNKKIHKNIHRKIIEHVNGRTLKHYWMEKGRYTRENENQIDWEALTMANKSFKFSDRVILMKLLANKAPTSEIMKQRRQYDDNYCPICNKEKETGIHIFQCEDIEMKATFDKGCKDIVKRLRRNSIIDERVIQDCRLHLNDIRNGSKEMKWNSCLSQKTLGNESLINGILHLDLRKLCNGIMGVRRIISEIFKFRINLWKKRCYLANNRENNRKRNEQLGKQYEAVKQRTPRNMSMIDKTRLMIDPETFHRMTVNEKELWIKSANQIQKKYERLARKGILRYYPPKRVNDTDSQVTRQIKKIRTIPTKNKQMNQPKLSKWYKADNDPMETPTKKRKVVQENEISLPKTYRTSYQRGTQEKITRWIRNQHNPGE